MTADLTLADFGFAPSDLTVSLDVDQLTRLALVLDRDPVSPDDPLPLLWHWACFTPTVSTSRLGPDGHPRPSDALADFPRRMWGAGSVSMSEPLLAGRPARRISELVRTRESTGASGRLLIAEVDHVYEQQGRRCLNERQTIIYRSGAGSVALPEGELELEPADGWRRAVEADPRLLFRYSAVTFNTHRIHYDLPYARDVEGYPALVVHGPLSAQLLAGEAADDAGRPLRSFTFRATAPLFAGLPFAMSGCLDGPDGTATITRNDGAVAMEASYTVGL